MVMLIQILLGLGLLVLLHELGHFLCAKMFGMRVEKFVIFMDVFNIKLFKFKIKETEYSMGWLPLGGYVKISGMIDESLDEQQMKEEPKPWEFRSKPAWQRIIVLLGGVIVNFIVAILIFSGILLFGEKEYLPLSSVKDGISVFEPGKAIGLKTGDQIIEVNGSKIQRFQDALASNLSFGGTYTVLRNGETVNIKIPDTIGANIFSLFSAQNFEPVLDEIAPESPAAKMGLKNGDKLKSINDYPITCFGDIRNTLSFLTKKDSLKIVALRNNEEKVFHDTIGKDRVLGVISHKNYELQPYNFFNSMSFGFKETQQLLNANLKGYRSIFTGKTDLRKSFVGPVGIAKIYGKEFHALKFWKITALISLLLAITNLLPIPALDGGHILIILIESIIRRKLSDKAQMVLQIAGIVVILSLLVLGTVNDILNF
jgi:regulator of sigma E protease